MASMIELYWLPLGAGDASGCVRFNGRAYEAIAAGLSRRPRCHLFHSALIVQDGPDAVAIEMAPVWGNAGLGDERGVVLEGPVGAAWLGRSRLFRYEVRCWRGGRIPDVDEAIASPVPVSSDPGAARHLLDLVPQFPIATWGRDEMGAGEMWNSNSLIAWLLARTGCAAGLQPPPGGRAPGWDAGLVVARRMGPVAEPVRP